MVHNAPISGLFNQSVLTIVNIIVSAQSGNIVVFGFREPTFLSLVAFRIKENSINREKSLSIMVFGADATTLRIVLLTMVSITILFQLILKMKN